MKRESQRMLSMDFGSKNIKIVDGIFKKGKLKIEKAYLLELPEHLYEDGYIKNEDILKQIIDSFLRLNNIKIKNTTAVINSLDILTRDIIIPNVKDSEISGILKYKISDYIPLDPKQYIIQYINKGIIVKDGNEMIRLFIIAMPRIIVDQHFNLLKNLGLKPKVLDYQANAIKKLLSLNEIVNSNIMVEKKTIASIDIGFFSTKLSILQNINMEIGRVIPLGLKDLGEGLELDISLESFLTKLFESIKMIFRYYNSQETTGEIELIVLQGHLAENGEVGAIFEGYLNIKTISISSLTGAEGYDLNLYSNAIGGIIRGDYK